MFSALDTSYKTMGKRPNKGSKARRLAREEVSLMITVRGECVTI